MGKGREQARAAIDAEHLQALAGQATTHEIAQEVLPLRGALGARQAEVDDLLLAVRPQAERDQHGSGQCAGAGLAPEHHAIQHQHAVEVPKWPAMERGDRGVELPGDGAHRGGADRPARMGNRALATLRVERPSRKQARIRRSTSLARLA